MRRRSLPKTAALAAITALIVSSSAYALSYSLDFFVITQNSPLGSAVGEQLHLEISDIGDQVLFTFSNDGPIQSTLTDIYFEEGASPPLQSMADIDNNGGSGNVDYDQVTGRLRRPPGSRPYGWGRNATEFRADPSYAPAGVDPGEYVGLTFDLSDGYTFDDIVTELENEEWRIGIHVQRLPDGSSETFFNRPPTEVPDLGSTWMLLTIALSSLGLAGWMQRRK
jgi:hypothetical protein